MRILYHHRSLGDGAEGIHIDEMIAAFRRLGHEVHTVSMARPKGHGEGATGLMSAARGALPPFVGEPARLLMNAPEYIAARGALTRARPDFVYVRHALFDVATLMASRRARVPAVLEVNALYSLDVARRFEPIGFVGLATRFEREALRSASLVVAVSTPLRNHVNALAGSAVRVMVIPNGANPDTFDPRQTDGARVRARLGLGNRFVIGWTGLLRSWHGLDILLRALPNVPDAALLLVGDGDGRPRLEQDVRSLGLQDRVCITGRVSHADVPVHVAAFDVAVAPDDGTGYASPMKVVEYMALARAVVVPRLPNFLDLVDDGETGVAFEPGNPEDLAARVNELRASPARREHLGRAARRMVETRLNWESNARLVLESVRRLGEYGHRAS